MAQTGLIGKWRLDEISKLSSGGVAAEEATYAITLEHTQALFYLIAVGYGLSSVVFLLEVIIGKATKGGDNDEDDDA